LKSAKENNEDKSDFRGRIRYFSYKENEHRYTRKFTKTVTLWFPCVPVKNESVGKVGAASSAERALRAKNYMQMTIPKAYNLANRFESAYKLLFTHRVGHISDCVAERINKRSGNIDRKFAHQIPLLTL
jgi:hypothetical protein